MEPSKDDEPGPGKPENVNHSLGLQDLYKAAFSQEYVKKEGGEVAYQKEGAEEAYQLYTMKKDGAEDAYQLYTMKQVSLSGQTVECYTTAAPLMSYGVYETGENNSVLDLDKGIQVQVVKMPSEDLATYSCDNHILQRYLHEASLLRGDSSSEPMLYVNRSESEFCEEDAPPDKLDLKFEECDFNSSDSFASTESIIPKNVKCPKCPKKFMFKSDLTRHNRHKHSIKQKLLCQVCNKEFPSQQNLLFHERSHKHSKLEIACHICNKVFKKPSTFTKHMADKHEGICVFRCLECPKVFTKASVLASHHQREHTEHARGKSSSQGSHVCDICGKSYSKPSYLKLHMGKHTQHDGTQRQHNVQLQDEQPNDQTSQQAAAQSAPHGEMETTVQGEPQVGVQCVLESADLGVKPRKSLSVDKPFRCEQCPKAFSYKASFNLHQKKHSAPIECKVCGVTFTTTADLTKHLRVHKTPKLIKCKFCSLEFQTRGSLRHHTKTSHKATTQETCTQTGEELFTLENMNVSAESPPQQSILLTPMSGFNSVPFIISHNQPAAISIPYSIAS